MNKKELKQKIKSMADFSANARKYIDTIIDEYSETDELQRVKELRNKDNTKHETKIKNQAEEITKLLEQKAEIKSNVKELNEFIAHQVDSFQYITDENRGYEEQIKVLNRLLETQAETIKQLGYIIGGKVDGITHLKVYKALYKEAMYLQVNFLGVGEDTASRRANIFAVQNTRNMYLVYNKYLELKENDE